MSDPGRDYRIVQADGTVRWGRQQIQVIRNRAGGVTEICGTVLDITERKSLEDHLRRLAHFDPLTGLGNRLGLGERLARTLAANEAQSRAMAVLFIDVDRFKAINDTLGHTAGDVLLKAIAVRMSHYLRASDFIARVGGDEFVIVLSPLEERADAAGLALRLAQACAKPYMVNEREFFSSISIGICAVPADATAVEDILRNADAAMYAAKAAGRNRYAFYDVSMHETVAERLLLENDLRQAVERDELASE